MSINPLLTAASLLLPQSPPIIPIASASILDDDDDDLSLLDDMDSSQKDLHTQLPTSSTEPPTSKPPRKRRSAKPSTPLADPGTPTAHSHKKRRPGRPPKSRDEVAHLDNDHSRSRKWKPITYADTPIELEEARESEIDPMGEQKITPDGVLLGDRRFKVNTFVLPMRHPTRRYVFAPDVAKAVGARDGFLLFQKYPLLTRLTTDEKQREYLCSNGYLASHLRGRNITIITARTMFRHFGHLVVRRGKPVRDDYFVGDLVYTATGTSDGELSDDYYGLQLPLGSSGNNSSLSTPVTGAGKTLPGFEVVGGDLGKLAVRFSSTGHGRSELAHMLAKSCDGANQYVQGTRLPKIGVECEQQYVYLAALSASKYSSELRQARAKAMTATPPKLVTANPMVQTPMLRLGSAAPLYPGVLDPYTGLYLVPRHRTPAGSIQVQVMRGSVGGSTTLEPRVVFPELEQGAGKSGWTSMIDLGLPRECSAGKYPISLAPGQNQASISLFQHRHTDPRHMPTHTVCTGSMHASHVRGAIPPLFPITSVVHGVQGTDSDLQMLSSEILASLVQQQPKHPFHTPVVGHRVPTDPAVVRASPKPRGRPPLRGNSPSTLSEKSVHRPSRLRQGITGGDFGSSNDDVSSVGTASPQK